VRKVTLAMVMAFSLLLGTLWVYGDIAIKAEDFGEIHIFDETREETAEKDVICSKETAIKTEQELSFIDLQQNVKLMKEVFTGNPHREYAEKSSISICINSKKNNCKSHLEPYGYDY